MDLLPWMKQWNMLPAKGGIILCAVSGGRDSICLLHYLYGLSKEQHFYVAAAHLDHMMRKTAQRDVDFVRTFCQERDIPFYLGRGDVYGKAKEWSCSTEESGRRLRYEFLEKTANEIGAERIATAHHLGDQSETVILNLVRGTGPEGLAGIPPVRGIYVRPLLQTSRKEIERYIQENELSFVEDETNSNLDFARNRLRLKIWPELEELNPSIQENIGKASEIVRKENAYLDSLAMRTLPEEGTEVDVSILGAMDEVLQARAIRILMARLPSGKKDVGHTHIEAIRQLLSTEGVLNLPGNMIAICRAGKLYVKMNQDHATEQNLFPGINHWGEYTITITEEEQISPNEKDTFFFPYDRIENGLVVRPWKRNDRLFLDTNRGERSLKRLFTDANIPIEDRNTYPVLCDGERAIAVCRIGQEKTYVYHGAAKYYKVIIRKDEEA